MQSGFKERFMSCGYESILNRRSVRSYKPESISDDLIKKIAEAGSYAPSAMGRQPGKIIVVRDKALRDRLEVLNARVLGDESKKPFYGAPDLIVVLADKSVPSYIYDGSLIMGNLMNAAQSLGVASCWINRAKEVFESEEGKEILTELGIEGDWAGIGNCILGYIDGEEPKAKARKEDFIVYAN